MQSKKRATTSRSQPIPQKPLTLCPRDTFVGGVERSLAGLWGDPAFTEMVSEVLAPRAPRRNRTIVRMGMRVQRTQDETAQAEEVQDVLPEAPDTL